MAEREHEIRPVHRVELQILGAVAGEVDHLLGAAGGDEATQSQVACALAHRF
jgi:hypothetical protein